MSSLYVDAFCSLQNWWSSIVIDEEDNAVAYEKVQDNCK